MMVPRFLLIIALGVSLLAGANGQSGTGASRAGQREYAVNLTFALYQYDAAHSPEMKDVTRLGSTFSTPEEEIAYLKDKHKLEEVAVRHIRSVGLRNGETFNDAVLLGPEYMLFVASVSEVVRGFMKLDFKVRYANEPMLDAKAVEMENYETVILRGGKGMFGVKYFIGGGGSQESVPVERTLLLSITPEIIPVSNLRNRPEQLSHPVDEYGSPLKLIEADRFTPPVALERVVPKFETGRAVRGAVLVGGIVTPDGRITNVKILRSIDPQIDERALDAFRQYRFSPGLVNGKPVHATYREEITFASPNTPAAAPQDEKPVQRNTRKRRWPFPIRSS